MSSLRNHRSERGVAALEFVALIPMVVLVALLTFQVGVAAWAVTSADKAARSAARAASLGQNPAAAAQASLPGNLKVASVTALPSPGGYGYRVAVEVPRFGPLKLGTVSRQAHMPEIES